MAAHDSDGGTLEQRLRAIEDRLEIYNLIATHPPSADTGAGEYTASVWTEDGGFDRGAEFPRPTGPAAIAGTSTSVEHRRAIEQGIAHFAGLPYVRVAGDTAFAISYIQILVPDRISPVFEVPNHGSSQGFHVHRVAASAPRRTSLTIEPYGSGSPPACIGRVSGNWSSPSLAMTPSRRRCAS